MPHRGRLIVFEGPDGVGKSTIAKAFHRYITTQGLPGRLLSSPGRGPDTLGRHIYALHHEPAKFGIAAIDPTSLQVLHIAAHIDAVERQIRPLLTRGQWVILDRFWWSTVAYGKIAGVPPASLKAMVELEQLHWQDIRPDAIILISRDRPLRRGESVARHAALTAAYEALVSDRHGRRIHVIRNEGRPREVLALVIDALADLFGPGRPAAQRRGSTSPSAVRENQTLLPLHEDVPRRTATIIPIVPTLKAAAPSEVYETYWRFAAERQEIFFRKLEGERLPWSNDPIFQRHKFTNAYRASDRVSQYLIRHVIYSGEQSSEEIFFRTILFKLFNSITTWELLNRQVNEARWDSYRFTRYDAVLSRAMEEGSTLYSPAYIMPPAAQFGYRRKHRTHLALLERMMTDEVPARLADSPSLRKAFELLRSYPGLGDFLAFQFVIDLNYSTMLNFSEMDFVVPGPGARDGIAKCFRNLGGLTEYDVIRFMAEHQADEFLRLGITFRSLWGRPLQLIDCQNLFCEVSKYARLSHPGVKGRSGRVRIKQLYKPQSEPIRYWYPPKWSLNEAIGEWEREHGVLLRS